MKKRLPVLLAIFYGNFLFSQKVDLDTLPKFDCNYKNWTAFSKDTVIIVKSSVSTFSTENFVKDFSGFLKGKFKIKSENELNKNDYNKSLLIIGKPSDFQEWDSFQLPIESKKKGFIFNKKKFFKQNDAIWLNQSNRVAVIANSLSSLQTISDIAQLGMDFVILQNNQLTFFGNFLKEKPNKIEQFNLQDLKTKNYNLFKEENANFYVSKSYKDDLNFQEINSKLNSYLLQFSKFYKIEIPKNKVNILIHNNQQEIQNMIGMWNLSCGGNTSGMNVRGELHCVGSNQGLINHEMSHHVFNFNIPAENLPPLLLEGVVECFANSQNSELFKSRISTIYKNFDAFNFKEFFENSNSFYNSNSALNYDLSGIWVQYFIETFGLENFKSFCRSENKIAFIESLSKDSFQKFNLKFRNWLQNKLEK